MGSFLLSVFSAEALSWAGFVVLIVALLGEAGIWLIPKKWEMLHAELAFALAIVAAGGYAIERVGDDAIIEALKKQSAHFLADAESARSDAANASAAAAQATEKLRKAQRDIAALQSQNVARRLRPEQKAALLAALSQFAGQKVYIFCSTSAWDCTPFATDFLETFKHAGWQRTDIIRYGIVVGYDAIGIEVLVNPQMADSAGQVSMPSVVTLINTLVQAGLMPTPALGRMPEVEGDMIYFRIGRIPPPK